MDVSDEDMSQVFKAVAGVLNCGNVKFRDVLDNDKTTEVVGVLDEQADAKEYARCEKRDRLSPSFCVRKQVEESCLRRCSSRLVDLCVSRESSLPDVDYLLCKKEGVESNQNVLCGRQKKGTDFSFAVGRFFTKTLPSRREGKTPTGGGTSDILSQIPRGTRRPDGIESPCVSFGVSLRLND